MLYQEKMITEEEVEDLKPAVQPWDCLAQIQCAKTPNVMNRTAELLANVGHTEEANHLKGQ